MPRNGHVKKKIDFGVLKAGLSKFGEVLLWPFRDSFHMFCTIAVSAIVVMIGIIGALTYGSLKRDYTPIDEILDILSRAKILEVDSQTYRLDGPYQVQMETEDISYIADFDAGVITIDGPDDADNAYPFTLYNNQEFIEKLREQGSVLADQILSVREKFNQEQIDWLTGDTDLAREAREEIDIEQINARRILALSPYLQ